MAKILGVELKSVKQGFGHERNGLEANVYLDGKKVGIAMNDGVGGCNFYHWDNPDAESTVESRRKEYFARFPSQFDDIDMFLEAILELLDLEKQFKKRVVKGNFKVLAYSPSRFEGNTYIDSYGLFAGSRKAAEEDMKSHERTDCRYFTDLSDFIIQ